MTRSQTPGDLVIHPRDLAFGRKADLAHYWLDGDPVATAFFNALSASFPQGERFFIDAVKAFRLDAEPHLRDQIAAFIAQEAVHTREHVVFNAKLGGQGYDFSRIDKFLNGHFAWARKRPPIQQLAATIALEHFTAILAHAALTDASYLKGAPPHLQNMWRWHAIEEIEHKSVAFDTFLAATKNMNGLGRWRLRCRVMLVSTILFLHELFFGVSELFRQDGTRSPLMWLRFLHYILVRPGMLRRVLPSYFAYFRPGFHPWQVDDRALIATVERDLAVSPSAS